MRTSSWNRQRCESPTGRPSRKRTLRSADYELSWRTTSSNCRTCKTGSTLRPSPMRVDPLGPPEPQPIRRSSQALPSMSSERPILFSGPMVRAILNGTKTQTRRTVKPQPDEDGLVKLTETGEWHDTSARVYRCPYGKPGDWLWVRESFARLDSAIWYQADCDQGSAYDVCAMSDGDSPPDILRWRPSIYMPRWASRITLDVVDIRVQRVQDISGPDCWAEGIARAGWDCERYGSVVECYRDLWESINGPGSWDVNPWAWVVEFHRLFLPIKLSSNP